MRLSRRLMRFLVGILCTASGAASATTFVRLSLEELVGAADAVARVTYLGSESRRENGEIWTWSRFKVTEQWKGAVPYELTVRLLGGRVGHLTSTVEGVPRFTPGEELILFLERKSTGEFSVTGWAQGCFRVHRARGTRLERVTQDSAAQVFVAGPQEFRSEGIRRMPIEEFQRRVAAAARGTPRRRAR